ncbi:hypothetical protein HOP50_02g16500 [Chloropicon primus]|uniref:Uncharacterized protein n=2 Tax=Chloropicon primus TaxID=1764295 RepID=A0A5B8MF77_9CHLO|nr:hypothetical protein A3770_02p16540 [Chloropicon primus]UPQ98344.1 hypothetical protein HOP50_02g16500 [Chloropicon primus]|eukprot:QDZ19136.1 hypothetical protein A3770_02p16540 [Chloropicon primus]
MVGTRTGLGAEIEKLRARREMLELDSASYSVSTVAKWRARLSELKNQSEAARARNERLVAETSKVSNEYHDSARVVQLSDKAFGYDVAVREYLKKVKKLLPTWIKQQQCQHEEQSLDKPGSSSPRSRAVPDRSKPRASPRTSGESVKGKVVLGGPDKERIRIHLSREGSFSARSPSGARGREPVGEEEEEEERQLSRNPSLSRSPAFAPVQTASFTNIAKIGDANNSSSRKRTPEQAGRSQEREASPVSSQAPTPPLQQQPQQPQSEKSRESRESHLARTTPKSRVPGSEVKVTPTRVRFLGEDVDLEDSEDTFESYADTGEEPSPVGKSDSQVYYTESERSVESFQGAYPASPLLAQEKSDQSRAPTPVRKDSPAIPSVRPTEPASAVPESQSEQAAREVSSTSSSSEETSGHAEEPEAPPPKKSSTPKEIVGNQDERSLGDDEGDEGNGGPFQGDAVKTSNIANRTFDTDTEESDVFYQSYQTKQLSKESSDEFDF